MNPVLWAAVASLVLGVVGAACFGAPTTYYAEDAMRGAVAAVTSLVFGVVLAIVLAIVGLLLKL